MQCPCQFYFYGRIKELHLLTEAAKPCRENSQALVEPVVFSAAGLAPVISNFDADIAKHLVGLKFKKLALLDLAEGTVVHAGPVFFLRGRGIF